MTRRHLLLIGCSVMLASCCEVNAPLRTKISIAGISEISRTCEVYPVNEIYDPSDLYSIGDQIVVVNHNKKCNLLYLYRRDDMSFERTFGSYGRAGNEFLLADRSPRRNNDSTLFLYTNFVECTEFRISRDSIRETGRQRITDDLRNNVIVLNDSLVFYCALQSDSAFGIYDCKRKRNHLFFGDFPGSHIRCKTDADRDNICLSASVYDPCRDRLVAFYESLPLMRIYDMKTYGCIAEIELADVLQQATSLDEYYDDSNVVYFSRPVAARGHIYVSLINERADSKPKNTTLLKVDWDGNIVCKYVMDKFCPLFTVSRSGEFYGIAHHENVMMLYKVEL